MYSITKTMYGVKIIFNGIVDKDEMTQWFCDSALELKEIRAPFSVLVDMAHTAPLSKEAQDILVMGQKLYKTKGMSHSAVILSDRELELQLFNIAKLSEIGFRERYFTESLIKDAIGWVTDITITKQY